MRRRQPKRGDRFIHARMLADGAEPPYDTDEKFRVHVVTAVKTIGSETIICHTTAEAWDADNKRTAWYFKLSDKSKAIRRWL